MKKIFIICFVLLASNLIGQNLPISSKQFRDKNLQGEKEESICLAEFNQYDYSSILLQRQDATLGFIGDNKQRLYVYFTSIKKDVNRENVYSVEGKSKVKSNVCEFQGEIKITHIKVYNRVERELLYKEALMHKDEEAMSRLKQIKGFVLAEYKLLEDSIQRGSGLFIGAMKSNFYIDKNIAYYDDLDLEFDDRYSNNQYVGVWKSFKTGAVKKCNWGGFRIPESNDLDIGAGEFSPNTKYLINGWESYFNAYIKGDKKALQEENKRWW